MKSLVLALALFGTVIGEAQKADAATVIYKNAIGMIHTGILTSTDIGMAKKGIGELKTADTSLWLCSRKGLPKRRSSFLQLKSCELLEFRR